MGERPVSAAISIARRAGLLGVQRSSSSSPTTSQHGETALGSIVYVDGLSGVFLIGVAFVYALVAIYSAGYLRPGIGHVRLRRLYWPLLNLFGLALLATPLVNDFPVLWVAVELTTVVSALLVTSEGNDASLEAGWKYVVIGSAGLAVGLFGIVLALPRGRSGTRRGLHSSIHELAPRRRGDVADADPGGLRAS